MPSLNCSKKKKNKTKPTKIIKKKERRMDKPSMNRDEVPASVSTLYLRNLPSRPKSIQNFTRLLLKSINPSNIYAQNPALPIPKVTFGESNEQQRRQQLLDTEYGILEISKSRSTKLKNQCFITFLNVASATNFKRKFGGKLKANGKLVDIQYSRQDSLLALSLNNVKTGLLKKVLKTRARKKLLRNDPAVARAHALKRQLRRLRARLRRKNLNEEDISRIIAQVQKDKERNLSQEITVASHGNAILQNSQKRRAKDIESNEPSKQARKSNPPNKILLVQNLPNDTTETQLAGLFGGNGLLEVRLVGVRNLAFIDYDTIENAATVKQRLGDTYSWNGNLISINFAK